MKKNIWAVPQQARENMDMDAISFVICDAGKVFGTLYEISNRITERAYSWSKIVLSVYPIGAGLVANARPEATVMVVLFMGFSLLVTGALLLSVIQPFPTQTEGDQPRTVMYGDDYLSNDICRAFMLSKIEALQQKIEIMTAINKRRALRMRVFLYVLFISLALFMALLLSVA
jgi:hypothetical protein